MARVRYHSGVWERTRSDPGFAAAATWKLDSSAVGSALKGVPLPPAAPGAEGGAPGRLVPGQGRRRGGSIDTGGSKAPVHRSAEVDHITSEAGVMTSTASSTTGPYPLLPGGVAGRASPVKERSLQFQRGASAAQALNAEPQPAASPSTLLVGSAAMKARHYYTHLAGSTVGSLLAMVPGQGEREGPRAAGVPVSEGARRTSISTAVSGGTRVLAAPHPPPSPSSGPRPGTALAAGMAARAGTEMAALTRPGTAEDPSSSFTTVSRLSYAGPAAHGGTAPAPTPLDKEQPRRRYGAAPAGANNPYRKTSIY